MTPLKATMQTNCDFPAAHSMDTEWFAIDAKGHVAIFSTGEEGDLPHGIRDAGHLVEKVVPDQSPQPALRSRGVVLDPTGMKESWRPTRLFSAGPRTPVLFTGGEKVDQAFVKRFEKSDAFFGSCKWSDYQPYVSARVGVYGYSYDDDLRAYVRVETLYDPVKVDQLALDVDAAVREYAATAPGDFSQQLVLSCQEEWPGIVRSYFETRDAPSVTSLLLQLDKARAVAHRGLTKKRPPLRARPSLYPREAQIPYLAYAFSAQTRAGLAQGRLALCGDRGLCARASWTTLKDAFVFLAPGNCFLVIPAIDHLFGLVITPSALEVFAIPIPLQRDQSLEDNATRWMQQPMRDFSNPAGIPREILALRGSAQSVAMAEFLRASGT